MDDPALDGDAHRQALVGLRRINRISGSARHVWQALRRHLPDSPAGTHEQPLRVLDLACGGADVAIGVQKLATRSGRRVQVDGCDISSQAIDLARNAASQASLPGRFFVHDALSGPLPRGYDAMTCCLFLHHLSSGQVVGLLARMAAATPLIIIDDLVRCTQGYCLAWLGTRLLTRSPVVHVDGLRSVRAAWTPSELADLARQASLEPVAIRRHFPCRMQLLWRRP